MPMDRSRYPQNWEEIALDIKIKANWTCQECGLICFDNHGQINSDNDDVDSLDLSDIKAIRSFRARHTLTVHHRDFTPENNSDLNLIALCSACHLAKHKGQKGSVSKNQLPLF